MGLVGGAAILRGGAVAARLKKDRFLRGDIADCTAKQNAIRQNVNLK